jgi:hypothetical protein
MTDQTESIALDRPGFKISSEINHSLLQNQLLCRRRAGLSNRKRKRDDGAGRSFKKNEFIIKHYFESVRGKSGAFLCY